MENAYRCFQENIHTKYIEDITNKHEINGLNCAMFKSIWYPENISNKENYYYAERLYINGKNGLKLGRKNSDDYRLVGFDIEAEDPRLVFFNNKLYIVFICISVYPQLYRGIGISEFDHWNPVYLRVRNMPFNLIEKNWAPFIKDDELYFVYSYDPLMIIKYDLNLEGFCDIVFLQKGVVLPIDTSLPAILRGGSNLIHYKDNYYIGGCHSRLCYKDRFNYFTHIILLNVENWEIVYVSKPIMYKYDGIELQHIGGVLYHITNPLIQSPVSINRKSDNIFYLTVNVCDFKTLLYEIEVDILPESFQAWENIGDIQHKTYNEMSNIYYAGLP